ncbi:MULTISPECIES: serine hydrolase domain-containing protein [Bacillus cereus group]|uniref:Beta-lactamase family protein n=2 Tax=Bacillus thuringiensis TaxID=1428 RepID=A0AAP4Q7R1_BACTU|nr:MULTISPECIES: serine hydrolase domain-containing protein [Bacillus cereus group]MEC2877524.1 serine hydrolase [Bacillus cereus]AGG05586.1 Beta-lactamase class C [Bacillus thuringiensis serovar thuringiensis str. IS5056]ARP61219.1 serine hydrolase [Bacillus thuringiensis]AST05201.1 serine hydrolase [Bacillus thuringiensis]EEM31646.1 Beta-lactamase [Bacillus thuringiensis serovar thuringiensis str. T01001]
MLTRDKDIAGLSKRVDEVINKAIENNKIIGTVTLICKDGNFIYKSVAGYADREDKTKMELDSIFRLASVTKPIVSAAALVLVSKKIIGLDDPITKWLPDFQPRLMSGNKPSITIRHLLTHTAGLTYGFLEPEGGGAYKKAGVSDGMDLSGLSLKENLKRLSSAPLLYKPGTNWCYSIAVDVLGAVISKAYEDSLQTLIKTLITDPLKMTNTSFDVIDKQKIVAQYLSCSPIPKRMGDKEVAQVFEGTAGIVFEPARAFDTSAFPSGGSGMNGTAEDFLYFLEELRSGDFLLPKDIKNEITKIQTGNLPLTGWPGRGFGLGFTILKDPKEANTKESIGTWRLGGAYGHSWFVDPIEKLTVVSFTNTAFEGMDGQFTVDLTDAIYG